MRGMVQWLSIHLSRIATRWIPDPLVIALLLTGVVFLWSATLSELGIWGTIDAWGGVNQGKLSSSFGLWRLLGFAMQMCLVLVTGYALASASWAQRVISLITARPQNAVQAIYLTSLIALLGGLINWGLGLILGAMTAREMGKSCLARGIKIHYPLICAAGYTGLLVWHGGLSGTAPLKVTQHKELVDMFGEAFIKQHQLHPISLYDTLGSGLNLWIMGSLLLVVPLLLGLMLPRDDHDFVSADQFLDLELQENQESQKDQTTTHSTQEALTFASRVENSRMIAYLTATLIGLYLYRYLSIVGFGSIDLNVINLAFICLGLVAHGSPVAYGQSIERATRGCAGILIQFPLYSGIMALMSASKLTNKIALSFNEIANAETMGIFTFFSAGLINLFVPSGGGQWAVQGPLLIESAQAVGAPLPEVIMAFAYGDAWTNMLQPFWALPLLGLTGVKARDIVGYTATLMICIIPVYLLGFWIF